jgi:hypothetical protein
VRPHGYTHATRATHSAIAVRLLSCRHGRRVRRRCAIVDVPRRSGPADELANAAYASAAGVELAELHGAAGRVQRAFLQRRPASVATLSRTAQLPTAAVAVPNGAEQSANVAAEGVVPCTPLTTEAAPIARANGRLMAHESDEGRQPSRLNRGATVEHVLLDTSC